jgi:hypothetical protein
VILIISHDRSRDCGENDADGNIGQSQIFHNIACVERCSSSMLDRDAVEEHGDNAVLDNDIAGIVHVDADVRCRGARLVEIMTSQIQGNITAEDRDGCAGGR